MSSSVQATNWAGTPHAAVGGLGGQRRGAAGQREHAAAEGLQQQREEHGAAERQVGQDLRQHRPVPAGPAGPRWPPPRSTAVSTAAAARYCSSAAQQRQPGPGGERPQLPGAAQQPLGAPPEPEEHPLGRAHAQRQRQRDEQAGAGIEPRAAARRDREDQQPGGDQPEPGARQRAAQLRAGDQAAASGPARALPGRGRAVGPACCRDRARRPRRVRASASARASSGVAASAAQAAYSSCAGLPSSRNAAAPSTPGASRGAAAAPRPAPCSTVAPSMYAPRPAAKMTRQERGPAAPAPAHGQGEQHPGQPGDQPGPQQPRGLAGVGLAEPQVAEIGQRLAHRPGDQRRRRSGRRARRGRPAARRRPGSRPWAARRAGRAGRAAPWLACHGSAARLRFGGPPRHPQVHLLGQREHIGDAVAVPAPPGRSSPRTPARSRSPAVHRGFAHRGELLAESADVAPARRAPPAAAVPEPARQPLRWAARAARPGLGSGARAHPAVCHAHRSAAGISVRRRPGPSAAAARSRGSCRSRRRC